jgi:hypothetical protein
VDVVMVCGILGNIDHAAVADTVRAVPAIVVSGGLAVAVCPLIRRPELRCWFIDAGMPEVSFDGEPEPYGVGVNVVSDHVATMPPGRLFTFRTAESS